ncbi:glycosyltransferase [Candidatus Omnitrophota bacterium]
MCAQESGKKFSFIIPTYNASQHLECCLNSIRGQRYPQEKIEILIIDGGSLDDTLAIAKRFKCRIFDNPKRLAEYGVQIGMQQAEGEFLVVFACDNELVSIDWVEKVLSVFDRDQGISAVWGRLASKAGDAGLNKYFQLIQSDPLNWFVNNNLNKYKAQAQDLHGDYCVFEVAPQRPLVWGANGLTYRKERIKRVWGQEGYLGDNDAFQCMIEQGDNKVAYFGIPFVYHHHVAKLSDWIKKWKRNFTYHLADKQKTRNMNWLFTNDFKMKLFFWAFYSLLPIFSLSHSIYLYNKDKDIHWFYHPIVTWMQFTTYAYLVIFTKKGRDFVKNNILLD